MTVAVSVIHFDAATVASWLEGMDADVRQHESPGDGACDVLVIGPDADEPIRSVQRIRSAGSDAMAVLLCPAESAKVLRSTVQISPLVGSDVDVVALDEAPEVALRRHVETTVQRRRSHAMQSFAQASLGAAPRPAARDHVFLDRLLEHAPIGVAVVGEDGRVVAWNRAARAITGRAERDVLAHPWQEALGAPASATLDARSLAVEDADGATHHLEMASSRVPLMASQPGHILLFQDVSQRIAAQEELQRTLDTLESKVEERTAELAKTNAHLEAEIDERRKAERTIQASEQRYRRLVETSHDLIWSTDAKGRFTFVNEQGAKRIYGMQVNQLIGTRPTDHSLEPSADRGFWDRVLGGQDVFDHASQHRTPTGRTVHTSWNGTPIHDGGRIIGASGTASDTTARQRALEEERKAIQRLKEVEELKQMTAFRTQFINTAAHELRTPLTPINVQLHLMEADGLNGWTDGQAHAFELVKRNMRRFGRLVEDLLEASRLQGGRLAMHPQVHAVDTVVRDVAVAYRAKAEQQNIRLLIDTPDQDVQAPIDEQRIGQVLQNLLNNAFKFTKPGGTIEVRLTCDGTHAEIQVRDSGIGIPADRLGDLFEPFSQVHKEDHWRQQGVGLGLYLAKHIVELHGGSMSCHSKGEGHGTTFSVKLPLQPRQSTGAPD